eukprot:755952-Hanusia_phi.AAC.1
MRVIPPRIIGCQLPRHRVTAWPLQLRPSGPGGGPPGRGRAATGLNYPHLHRRVAAGTRRLPGLVRAARSPPGRGPGSDHPG